MEVPGLYHLSLFNLILVVTDSDFPVSTHVDTTSTLTATLQVSTTHEYCYKLQHHILQHAHLNCRRSSLSSVRVRVCLQITQARFIQETQRDRLLSSARAPAFCHVIMQCQMHICMRSTMYLGSLLPCMHDHKSIHRGRTVNRKTLSVVLQLSQQD